MAYFRRVNRDGTYWLLGLPFDAVDLNGAVQKVAAAARSGQRLIVVTPNVNFVSLAASDAAFRDTVLASQLSLVDGMPLVWLGRRLGIPFRERVAGSTLLERLAAEPFPQPLRVYFFGGEPGVSERAARRLRQLGPGLVAAGYHDPGFGPIESMSTDGIIADINGSRADLLILSLGAKKGHQWIARNAERLDVPVITHLGAAVNFVAGTVKRAPEWMQRTGLEWIWRIRQEPKLFQRYWTDGQFFLRALTALRKQAPADVGSQDGYLASLIDSALQSAGEKVVDISNVRGFDARSLGLLYGFRFRGNAGEKRRVICSSPRTLELLRHHRADCLLSQPPSATSAAQ